MKIMQLVPTLAYGDAVGNDTMALREVLKDFGYETNIYAEDIDERIQKDYVQHYRKMPHLEPEDIIFYHFAIGNASMAKLLKEAKCRKVMIYHNITPGKFFEEYDQYIKAAVDSGREQLENLKEYFGLCLCDSAYNMEDLRALGYKCPMAVLPIIIPFEDYAKEPDVQKLSMLREDGIVNILFVGRIAPNKKQEDIIKSFVYYHNNINSKSRLFLVGSTSSELYKKRLDRYVDCLGMKDVITFTGAIAFKEILAYYSTADLFLCMSEHEGFCVPLLEAMCFDVPVLAYDEAAIAETMGEGTGCIDDKSPAYVAACMDYILANPEVRENLVAAQRKNLERFDEVSIKKSFKEYLDLILEEKYKDFSSKELRKSCPSYFGSLKLEGKGEDGGILSFEKVQIPMNISWRKVIKRKIFRPAYVAVSKCSPDLAVWMKKKIFTLYHNRRMFEPVMGDWDRTNDEPCVLVDTTRISIVDFNTGIQRVVNNIFTQLSVLERNIMAVRDVQGEMMTSYRYMKRHDLIAGEEDGRVTFRQGDKLLLMDSGWEYVDNIRKYVRNIQEGQGSVAAVIYDLFPVQYPEFSESVDFKGIFSKWHTMILEEADDVICISRTVADNVEKYYQSLGIKRKMPLKLHYFPMGADFKESKGVARNKLKKFVESDTTFLMVGTIEPRKGYAVAIQAFEKLIVAGKEAKLLIIGKEGWKNDGFEKLTKRDSIRDNVLWLKDADDAELQWAYKHASALIGASKDEGFGLPLIEAAHYGIPIIASDIPIFHEVAGEYADYFKAMDSDDLCNVLIKWLATDVHPDSKKIRLYTWQESAQVILDIMNHKQDPYKILQ